ncbi:hypothetical protein MP478_09470 [Chryseobacterium sp. WG14]|uniref:hypothetical protein n=1 Tax=unclassified Chryseobacterium TaxID=2593645 RepID=UPI00211F0B5D|nr:MULTISPECIES: hypothetical protein [unclassified Chryseobacterium]MCQ9633363.1 hypothetical protein [Chryseobacterium sp. WG23]MCQ9639621.1 hypothetical protein [Chryseobacterium sp. WG14]
MMSLMLIGFLMSCKKETRTETTVTDTVSVDTTTNIAPMPSDTVRADTVISPNNKDTAQTIQNKTIKK